MYAVGGLGKEPVDHIILAPQYLVGEWPVQVVSYHLDLFAGCKEEKSADFKTHGSSSIS